MRHLGTRLALALAVLVPVVGGPSRLVHANFETAAVLSCKPSAHLVCVTAAASGKTTRMRLGEELEVSLERTGFVWSALHEVGPAILREIGPTRDVDGSLSATYRSVGHGKTALEATGGPRCTKNEACPQFLLLWRTEVLVSS